MLFSMNRRRLFFAGAGATLSFQGLRFGSAIVGLGSIGMSTRPQAEPVTTGLAIASAVAGMIAAHNRSDGGLSSILRATLDYQRITASQLQSIQSAMAELLTSVKRLSKEMQDAFYAERLAKVRQDIGTVADSYMRETIRSSTFDSWQLWVADDRTRDKLKNIVHQVDTAVSAISYARWLDPMTAMHLPMAATVSLGARTALGEQPQQLRAEAQRYIDLFENVADSTIERSAAAELETHQKHYNKLVEELLLLGFEVPSDATQVELKALIMPFAIRDYAAPKAAEWKCVKAPRPPRGDPHPPPDCWKISEAVAERNGPTRQYAYVADVFQNVVFPGDSALPLVGIRQYRMPGSKRLVDFKRDDYGRGVVDAVLGTGLRFDACIQAMVPQRICPEFVTNEQWDTRVADAPTSDAMRIAAERLVSAESDQRMNELSKRLEELNLKTVLIAQCLGSLFAVAAARRAVLTAFEKG